MISDCRFIKNMDFIADIMKHKSKNSEKFLFECGKYKIDDFEIDFTKIIYVLLFSDIHDVIIKIPYKRKNDNKILMEIEFIIRFNSKQINKIKLIDYFSHSNTKLKYEVLEDIYIIIGEYEKCYELNIDFNELKCKDKPQKLCYACIGFEQPIYLLEIIDEDHYYNIFFNK